MNKIFEKNSYSEIVRDVPGIFLGIPRWKEKEIYVGAIQSKDSSFEIKGAQ